MPPKMVKNLNDSHFFSQQELPDILAITLQQQVVIGTICYVLPQTMSRLIDPHNKVFRVSQGQCCGALPCATKRVEYYRSFPFL